MARITDINFAAVGTLEGCSCDRCGQWIKNIWTVKFDDGITAHFGIDCYEQMCKDSRLSEYGMKLMKKTLKRLKEWETKLADYEAGKYTAENDIGYQFCQSCDGGHYWKGRPYEEYRAFEIECIREHRIPEVKKELEKFKKVNFKRTA